MYNPTDVTRVIRYQYPEKAIYKDEDCSLFMGNNARLGTPDASEYPCWYTAYWRHIDDVQECHSVDYLGLDISRLGGIYCSTPIRRMEISNYSPGSLHYKNMYVMLNDDDIFTGMEPEEKIEYYNEDNYSIVAWRRYPIYHWAVPMVSNHKYRIVWGDSFI